MADALIGHTGFVGGNLARQRSFDATYNSTNIEDIAGRELELLVCAGAPGAKWKANREPERDLESVVRLTRALETVRAGHVVLISTVDVYPVPRAVDEASVPNEEEGSAYGRHRLQLERFVRARFEATVIRLPGLFGPGLKKNVVYDFLHRNRLEAISPDSEFQFYPILRLWSDVERVRRAGLSLVNFATEPTSVRRVASEAFGFAFDNPDAPPPVFYDVRTKYAEALGGEGPYLYDAEDVLAELRAFVASVREGE